MDENAEGLDEERVYVDNDMFEGLNEYVENGYRGFHRADEGEGEGEGMFLDHPPLRKISKDLMDDEGFSSKTSEEQRKVERLVGPLVRESVDFPSMRKHITLKRDEHVTFLLSSYAQLGAGYSSLDASKPWLCYWIVHALALLNEPLGASKSRKTVAYLERTQSPTGGFCGGPQQLAHLAPSYATVLCLAEIGLESGFRMIDRPKLYRWLLSLKQPNGSFAMHHDGEADVRATYCALVVAQCTQLLTEELLVGVADFVVSCQSFEGGFSSVPGNETHGGYTFCGCAAAMILGIMDRLDLDALLQWCSRRQMSMEGGYSGRCNKLVDSCYSFWVGSVPVMIAQYRKEPRLAIDEMALQEYLLLCCQNFRGTGGMVDKPGKYPDLYHTCYALSGLSLAQNPPTLGEGKPLVLGVKENWLVPTNPVFNVLNGKAEFMMQWFKDRQTMR